MRGLEFKLDDDLLSHGETPHYHRRCVVSLLSSGWDQVVPTLYGRQAIRVESRFRVTPNWVCVFRFGNLRSNFRFVRLHTVNLRAFAKQIAWVLYGQASRAISMG